MAFTISTGDLLVTHDGLKSTDGVDLRVREGFYNVEQACSVGFIGDPVPAGTVFDRTQSAANAAAAALLDCKPIIAFEERFEGPGYENTWIEEAGSPDDQHVTSPAPLAGSYSLYMPATATSISANFDPLYGDTYAFFKFRVQPELPIPGVDGIFEFTLTGGYSYIRFSAVGLSSALNISDEGGTIDTDPSYVANTLQCVWIDYITTTGAIEVRVSATTTRPVSALLSGTATPNIRFDNVRLYSGLGRAYADDVIVSRQPIGSNP